MVIAVLLAIWRRLTEVDAIDDARRWSHEQTIRPFSDKYDESGGGKGAYGVGGGVQMRYSRGLSELARDIEKRPPAPPHPRSREEN
jgi:hypothetical protein